MKKIVFILLSAVFVFAIVLCIVNIGKGEEDVNHCLVKYKSEWNKPCLQCLDYSQSYRVYFRNECNETIDVKCAAQQVDKRWKTFTKLSMVPNDTIVAYACKGNGKYMKWVRKSGDTTVPFPGDEEINELYTK
jgi:hypothetical protein